VPLPFCSRFDWKPLPQYPLASVLPISVAEMMRPVPPASPSICTRVQPL
jgi:hypothetical protein